MSTAVRIIGRWDKSLNTSGEEIWALASGFGDERERVSMRRVTGDSDQGDTRSDRGYEHLGIEHMDEWRGRGGGSIRWIYGGKHSGHGG